MARASLGVGRWEPQLILPLLVAGLSLAPGFAALVPVVPRGAHRSALAGKRASVSLTTLSGDCFSLEQCFLSAVFTVFLSHGLI